MKSFVDEADFFIDLFLSVTTKHKNLSPNKLLKLNGSELFYNRNELTYFYGRFVLVVRNDEIKIGDGKIYFISTSPKTNDDTKQHFFWNSIEKRSNNNPVLGHDNLYWGNMRSYDFVDGEFTVDGLFNVMLEGGPRIPADFAKVLSLIGRIREMMPINFNA